MKSHNPPANDAERIQSLRAALAALEAEDDDDATDEEIRAEAEAHGIDFEAWGAEIKAMAQAKLDAERAGEGSVEPPGPAGAAPAALGLVAVEDILHDGPTSANDVEAASPGDAALEQVASAGGRSWAERWHLRRVARAVLVGLAAAGIVAAGIAGLGSVALRWVTAQSASLARKMTARGVDGARVIEGATARARVLSQQGAGEAGDGDPPEPGE